MKYKYLLLILFSLFLFPIPVFGATIFLEPSSNTISAGNTAVINLLLNTEGETLNSIDGELSFSTNTAEFNIKDINVGPSDFRIWLNPPTLSADKKTISFVGGVPGGIKSSGAKIFSIAIEGVKPGDITINFTKTLVYKNDGKGTSLIASFTPSVISIVPENLNTIKKDEWSEIIKNDTEPPNEFIIELGSDPSVFDGKKFISFQANDDHSGIDYYEVTEGNLEPVRTNSPYVLMNQDENERIKVTAFDKNGNSRVSIYEKNIFPLKYLFGLLAVVIIVLISYLIYNKKKKKYEIN